MYTDGNVNVEFQPVNSSEQDKKVNKRTNKDKMLISVKVKN